MKLQTLGQSTGRASSRTSWLRFFFIFYFYLKLYTLCPSACRFKQDLLAQFFFFKPVSDFFLTCVYFLYLFLWGPSTGSRVRENLLAQVCVCVGAWVRWCVGGEEKDGPLILCPLHYIDVPYRYVGVS